MEGRFSVSSYLDKHSQKQDQTARLKVFIQSKYLFPMRMHLRSKLENFRKALSQDEEILPIRRYHRVLDETLISVPHMIVLDGIDQAPKVFVGPYSRRAFGNLLTTDIGPGLLNFETESWQFCDAAMQVLAHVLPSKFSAQPSQLPTYDPEPSLHLS